MSANTARQPKPMPPTAPLAPSGPPRLTAASSDADLLAALQRNPGLLQSIYGEASRAQHGLMQQHAFPVADFGVATFWADISWKYRAALPREQPGMAPDAAAANAAALVALRIILAARDALCDLAADIPRLNHADLLVLRQSQDNAKMLSAEYTAAALVEIAKRFPGFARWQELRRKAAEAAQAEQEALRARQSEAAAAEQTALRSRTALELLRRVSAGGVRIAMEGGELRAHPPALLAPQDRQQLGQYRAEVVSLLNAPAEVIA